MGNYDVFFNLTILAFSIAIETSFKFPEDGVGDMLLTMTIFYIIITVIFLKLAKNLFLQINFFLDFWIRRTSSNSGRKTGLKQEEGGWVR